MSGHSKWHNIKHKKAVSDQKKAKIFTKLIKEIAVVARSGGGDPVNNPALRTLLDKARAVNMPQENSQRAIKRGTGELPGASYEAHRYEGYGPGGIALIVDVLSDNKNRAIAEIRALFARKGGSLAEQGAVAWMFDHVGIIKGTTNFTEDNLVEMLLEYDIKAIVMSENKSCTITCALVDLAAIKEILQDNGFIIEDAEPEWVAKESIELSDEKQDQAIELLQALENLDDVQNVYTNLA